MEKWHITAKGVPAICKAKKGRCPLGEHFNSHEEAQIEADKLMDSEYGLLPKVESQIMPESLEEEDCNISEHSRLDSLQVNSEKIKRRKDFASLIKRISGVKTNGFDYECFASMSIAEELGLDNVAVIDENGLIVNLNINGEGKTLNADVFVNNSIEGLSAYYSKLGIPIKDKKTLARVVYYNPESDNVLVQSGGPNVLDAAIVKANEVVDIIEVKELERGAQLPLISLDVDRTGAISEASLSKQRKPIANLLEKIKIQDVDGVNTKLDFGNDLVNEEYPLYHFVEEYKGKGATSFIYTTQNGSVINKVDLTRPTGEVIDDLKERKIEASLNLRANLQRGKVTEDDIYRFNKILSKDYFHSGKPSNTKTFKLSQIKEEKISNAGKYVRIGGFILPIEYETYKDHLEDRIKKEDMLAFKLSLTGKIKTNY